MRRLADAINVDTGLVFELRAKAADIWSQRGTAAATPSGGQRDEEMC